MSSAAYPVINGYSCIPEIQVAFKTFDRTDNQTYRGRVLGCVNYDVASNFGDLIAQHNNMKPSVAKREVTTETFILVKTVDGATRAFAVNWIDTPTFRQTDKSSDATIVVHNVTQTQLYQILTSIRDQGYDATQA